MAACWCGVSVLLLGMVSECEDGVNVDDGEELACLCGAWLGVGLVVLLVVALYSPQPGCGEGKLCANETTGKATLLGKKTNCCLVGIELGS